jgi:hypothetical protein
MVSRKSGATDKNDENPECSQNVFSVSSVGSHTPNGARYDAVTWVDDAFLQN